jgi:hypothetical protein
MVLKLIGADCSNGLKILKNLNKVERELTFPLDIKKISTKDKNKYDIKITPTLIIEDKIVSSGNVLSEKELKNIIKQLIEA